MGISLDVTPPKKVAFSLFDFLAGLSGGIPGDRARLLNDCFITVLAAWYSGTWTRAAPGLFHRTAPHSVLRPPYPGPGCVRLLGPGYRLRRLVRNRSLLPGSPLSLFPGGCLPAVRTPVDGSLSDPDRARLDHLLPGLLDRAQSRFTRCRPGGGRHSSHVQAFHLLRRPGGEDLPGCASDLRIVRAAAARRLVSGRSY